MMGIHADASTCKQNTRNKTVLYTSALTRVSTSSDAAARGVVGLPLRTDTAMVAMSWYLRKALPTSAVCLVCAPYAVDQECDYVRWQQPQKLVACRQQRQSGCEPLRRWGNAGPQQ